MLKAENIHYSIGSKTILNGISAEFKPGLFHVIVGPNGSGKSTFLKICSGELQPTQGKVLYDDQNIFRLTKIEIAKRRSVMSQQAELHFPLSVAEIVMMGRYPHFNYKPSVHDKSVCEEAIKQMDIKTLLERDYLTLSGGEKQRVQFARTLTQIWETPKEGSRYLFLDEPINNVDIYYQHHFLQLAKAFTTAQTVTVAVLHDINLAVQYADTITFINNGLVVSHGETEAIITSKLVKEVFHIRVEIIHHPSTNKPYLIYTA